MTAVTVARAHTDSRGKRWEIGDVATGHPDARTHPWLFESPTAKKTRKPKE